MIDLYKLSKDHSDLLIQIARNSLEAIFSKIVSLSHFQHFSSQVFPNRQGVFVGLWIKNEMRSCIGTPYPDKPLDEMIPELTLKCALEDPRYSPISIEELSEVKITIDVLTTPQPSKPHQIQLGVHGLIIHHENQSAVLLPQIAIESGLNEKEFLAEVCLKAGLHSNAWLEEDAQIYTFESQVIREK